MTMLTNEARHEMLSKLSGTVSIEGKDGDELTVRYKFTDSEAARDMYYKLFHTDAPKVKQFGGVVDRASDHSEYLEYKREIMEIDEKRAQEES